MGSEVERLLQRGAQRPTQNPTETLTETLLRDDDATRLKSSFDMSNPKNADRSALMLRLQDRTQLPIELIDRNFDEIVKEAQKADFDPVRFRQSSPIVAAWLAERPEHTAVASEDLSRLNYFERQIRFISDQYNAGRATVELRDIGEQAMLGTATPAMRKRQKEIQTQLGRLQDVDYGITGFFEGIPGAVANQLPIMGRTLLGSSTGALAGATAGGLAAVLGGQAGPQVALPEETITVPAAAGAGARMGWQMGAITEAGRMEASLAFLEFEDYKNADGTPLDRNAALGAAAVVGMVNGLLESFGFNQMMKKVPGLNQLTGNALKKALASPTTRRSVLRYLRGIGEVAAAEGMTEFMQEVTKNAAGVVADPDASTLSPAALLDRIFQGALQAGRMGAQAGGGFATVASSPTFKADLAAVRRAERAKEFFDGLAATAQDSKLLERSPDKMQEVITRLTKDGPVEHIYLPSTTFTEFYQSKGVEPREVAQALGIEAAYDESIISGDLQIPTAVYAAKLAKTEAHKTFAEELRLGPGELSFREAQEKIKQFDQEETEAAKHEATQQEKEGEEITQKITTQLMTARPDLYDERTARTAAEILFGRVFQNLSQATGHTPMELWNRYGLSVQLGTETEEAGFVLGQATEFDEVMMEQLRKPTEIEQQFALMHKASLDQELSEEMRAVAGMKARKLKPHAEAAMREREARLENFRKYFRDQRTLFQTDNIEARLAELKARVAAGEEPKGAFAKLMPGRNVAYLAKLDMYTNLTNMSVSEWWNQLPLSDRFEFLVKPAYGQRWAKSWMKASYDEVKALAFPNQTGTQALQDAFDKWKAQVFEDVLNSPDDRVFFQEGEAAPKPFLKGFHSRAERLIEQKMPNKMPAPDFISFIKSLGIKAEELKWSRLGEWLEDLLPEAVIFKSEVLEFLRFNRLEVVEETKTGDESMSDDAIEDQIADEAGEAMKHTVRGIIQSWENSGMPTGPRGGRPRIPIFLNIGSEENPQWVFEVPVERLLKRVARQLGVTQREFITGQEDFAEYVDVSNQPWRRMPTEASFTPASSTSEEDWYPTLDDARQELLFQIEAYMLDAGHVDIWADDIREDREERGEGNEAPFAEWTLPGGDNYRVIAFRLPGIAGKYMLPGSHRSVNNKPNVVAHARVKDRVLPDGRKVLFIEEIQSDWHQAGREQGYAKPQVDLSHLEYYLTHEGPYWVLHKRNDQMGPDDVRTHVIWGSDESREAVLKEARNHGLSVPDDVEEIDPVISDNQPGINTNRTHVPDAPFKNTVHEFVIKRLIAMAAEDGYDGVGMTTGEQQAERWNLSTHVDALRWEYTPPFSEDAEPGTTSGLETPVFRIQAWTPDQSHQGAMRADMEGRSFVLTEDVKPRIDKSLDSDQLNDNIGKELSRKIYDAVQAGETTGIFEGEDLKVGGHSRVHQYDVIFAGAMKDLAKKFKSKVEMSPYQGRDVSDGSLATVVNTEEGWMVMGYPDDGPFLTREAAVQFGDQQLNAPSLFEAYFMALSPELKKAALANEFTLYQMRKAEKGFLWDGAMAELESLESNDMTMRMQEFVHERDAAAAYAMLAAMPGEMQSEFMTEMPITFQWIMQSQVLNQSRASMVIKDARNQLSELLADLKDMDTSLESVAYDEQEEIIRKVYGKKAADNANYGQGVWEKDDGEIEIDTKVYVEGHPRVISTISADGSEIHHEWDGGSKTTYPKKPEVSAETQQLQRLLDLVNRGTAKEAKQLFVAMPKEMRSNIGRLAPAFLLWTKTSEMQQGEKKIKKGRIRIGQQSIRIDLLKDADLSTFLHETGHFYLEVLHDLATEKGAKDNVKADYATIRKWLGVEGDAPLTREHHEKFARGFEKYMAEGRAPVAELRRAFARFKAWLFTVYASLNELDVELTDEVRTVFDKLIAGHEAIAEAEKVQGIKPLDLSGLGLPKEEQAKYEAAFESAQLAAQEELTARIIEEFEREKSRVWQAERQKVRESVANEANEDPTLRARALLQRGTLPDGSPLPVNLEGFKLSRVAIHAQWPAEIEAGLDKRLMARGHGTIHPNIAADILGFQSGDELLNALVKSVDPLAWIERTTNERMRSRRFAGTPIKQGELQLEAMKAVHNEKRAQLLAMELKYLASEKLSALKGMVRRVARRVPSSRDVREEAEQIIAAKPLREVNALMYQRAEQQARDGAIKALLKGDAETAFDLKLKEQMANALYRAATDARTKADKIVTYFARFDEKRVRERLTTAGGDYLLQIDGIRERFDFAKSVSLKDLDKRRSLREFVDDELSYGLSPAIPPELLREAYRKHWKEMSLGEMTLVYDGVKVIEKLARLKNRLLANNRVRTVKAAVEAMLASIREHHEIKPEDIDYAPGMAKRILSGARGFSAAHQKPEFIAEWLDGNKNLGPVWSMIFKPIADAEAAENKLRRQKVVELRNIFSNYTTLERSTWFWQKVDFGPGLGSLTKANRLTIALNWGNTYNREALLNGNKLSESQVLRVLDTLDERDWQTVQAIWDYLDSFWPDIARLEKELNGVAPEKVEALPFVMKGVQLRGGYYPIVFDSRQSFRQAAIDIREGVTELFGGQWARAMTKHGHTFARTNTGDKPLRLDLSGLTDHVTNVMHDLTHRRAVIDVSRLIRNSEFKQGVESTIGKEFYKQLHPWLVNVAAGQKAEFFNPIEGIMGRARTGATIVNMGWKLTTAMVQFLSFTNTIKELGLKYASLGVSDVYGKPWTFKRTWTFVTDRSEFMKHRIENFDRDVNDALKNLNVAGVDAGPLSVIGAYTRPVRDSYFMFIGLMDMGVSLPTWMGAYRRAMEGSIKEITKGDEPAAIDYADKIVRQTQGVGAAKDMAAVQRGPNTLKLFTMFYSYFSVLYNQFAKTTHQVNFDKNVPRFVASMLLLWIVPAALEDFLRGNAPDDDDDPTNADWFKWLLTTEARYPFQSIVVVRDIINGMDQYGYEPSAAFDMFENISKAGKAGLEMLPVVGKEDDEFTRAELKSVVHTVGYTTPLPTRQLWLTLEYMHDWLTGEEEPANPLEAAWRAAVAGKRREP